MMTRLTIHFPTGETVSVSPMFANGMCDVFKESTTIYAGALSYSTHANVLTRIANVFSENMQTTHVRVITKLVSLSPSDLIAVLEVSNYFGHEYMVDTAATVIAKRLPRMSQREIQNTFGVDPEQGRNASAPLRHIIRHVPPTTW